MKVIINRCSNNWADILNAARVTANKADSGKEPGSEWKRRLIHSEHSPLRKLTIDWTWTDLKYWISVHFCRHKIGIEHFVASQRTANDGSERDASPQDQLVTHNCSANAAEIIFISRKRLCKKAHKETREAWQAFLDELAKHEPELVQACVPECVYRNGICPEFNTCGWNWTEGFMTARGMYVLPKQINDNVSCDII